MTERLSDVTRRIGTVRQLSAVITAMRGIAAARARAARSRLDGVRAHAAIVASAIGRALAMKADAAPDAALGASAPGRGGGHAVIALCAEQGFAGVFSERVLDAVAAQGEAERLLVGDRGLMLARERGLEVAWSAPMAVHPGQVPDLADRIAAALYARLDGGRIDRVTIVHAIPGAMPGSSGGLRIAERRLVPFDYGRFPVAATPVPPLVTMPVSRLLERLVEEYIFAELCEAVMLSLAAENEARVRAMIAARSNVADTLSGLVGRSRRLRQEQITSEIIELAGGAAARGV